MNNKMKQINEATNKYVKEQNERLPNIRHIIMNPKEYGDDAQLVTEVSTLYRATLDYVQSVDKITGSNIVKTAGQVDEWLMSRYKIIKLNKFLEEIQDRAIEGLTIPKERLRSIASPHIERLYDANYENMYVPDSRHPNERQRDHQEYEYALVVTEYIKQEPVRYAIYKGNRQECGVEFDRFEESKRLSKQRSMAYRDQNGNDQRATVKYPITRIIRRFICGLHCKKNGTILKMANRNIRTANSM